MVYEKSNSLKFARVGKYATKPGQKLLDSKRNQPQRYGKRTLDSKEIYMMMMKVIQQ
jgi:hypothetical protein